MFETTGKAMGFLRGVIQGAQRIGLSLAETAGLIEGAGIEFDIAALHEEASLYNQAISYARDYRERDPTKLVSGMATAVWPGELKTRYKFEVEQDWMYEDGVVRTKYSSVTSDERRTPQQILDEGEQDMEDSPKGALYSVTDPKLHAFWRREE